MLQKNTEREQFINLHRVVKVVNCVSVYTFALYFHKSHTAILELSQFLYNLFFVQLKKN